MAGEILPKSQQEPMDPCKQRPMKLIRLVSLVFVKVHMARDLAVLVMSSGESQTKSKTS